MLDKQTSNHGKGKKKPRGAPGGSHNDQEKNKYEQSRQGTTDVDCALGGRKAKLDDRNKLCTFIRNSDKPVGLTTYLSANQK